MLNPAKGMRLDEDTAFQYVKQIAEALEKVSGVLTLLWHPNHIVQTDWWSVYLRTLEYLNGKNVYFGSVREIGECKLFSRRLPRLNKNKRRFNRAGADPSETAIYI